MADTCLDPCLDWDHVRQIGEWPQFSNNCLLGHCDIAEQFAPSTVLSPWDLLSALELSTPSPLPFTIVFLFPSPSFYTILLSSRHINRKNRPSLRPFLDTSSTFDAPMILSFPALSFLNTAVFFFYLFNILFPLSEGYSQAFAAKHFF